MNNDPTACINFPGVKSQCSNIITKPPCSKETATPTQVVLKYSVRGCMNRPFLTLAHLFTRDKRIECTTMWRTFSIVCVCYLVQVSLNQTTTKSQDESGQDICGGTNQARTVGLKKGETESLQCNLTRGAGPNTTIKWFAKNPNQANIDLHVSGDTLTIRNISKTCVAQLYRCEVFVSGKSVCNQTFKTSVLGSPAVYIFPEEENIKTDLHDDHLEIFLRRGAAQRKIVCSVDADPPSNITWYEPLRHGMNDMLIGYLRENEINPKMTEEFMNSGDSYRFLLQSRILDNILLTRELVIGIQVGDDKDYNRTYTCSATNKYGTDSWSVKIMRDYS